MLQHEYSETIEFGVWRYTEHQTYPLHIKRGPTQPKTKNTGENSSSRPCTDKTIITNKAPSAMGPQWAQYPSITIKLKHPYYHCHCQGFSHLSTSIKLMIIAKEENRTQPHKQAKG